jgi:hypothetical protein
LEFPGNPLFQATKISRKDLKRYYRPHLIERSKEENSVHDIIYYYKGVACAYEIFYDMKKFVEDKRPIREVEDVDNELFIRKLEIDK